MRNNKSKEIKLLKKKVDILKEEIQNIVDALGHYDHRDRYEKLKEEYAKI